ncbi:MAG: Bifunctional folate synthesis protein [Eubacterium sp.]|jgi:dihydroneopterin aldolase/2-amino-4-hydroxy-6-hydroxymethyldihydropteridine diphosphokinase|nr:Bifunctional folate synthesis protein [Eubacterium sp.]
MDKIIIEDLEIYAYHGIAEEEKKLGQLFIVSLQILADLDAAARNCDLNSTINYAEVCDEVQAVLRAEKHDLIETAALKIIEGIFIKFKNASAVKILLKKPWAPMGHHLKYAAVELERTRGQNGVTAYIALGSNLGDRASYLKRAVEMLGHKNGITVTALSSFYNTAPVGFEQQPDFLNAAVAIKTTLPPDELLQTCAYIESDLKRERIIHWGPRTIDLDILLYGDQIINKDELKIPHPRMHERRFVLEPLNELAPQALHPVSGKTVRELYESLLKE